MTVDEALVFARIEGSHYIGAHAAALKVLAAEVSRLQEAVAFAAVCIRSGEPWTKECEDRLKVRHE